MNLRSIKRKKEKERIIENARQVFKKFGYKKATINDIAEASGKAKSSVYYYFKSKDEVYDAVIFSESKKYRDEVLKTIGKLENPKMQLKSYILIRLQTDKIYSNFYYEMTHLSRLSSPFIKKLKKYTIMKSFEFSVIF